MNGEDVVIDSTWNMIYDLAVDESEVLIYGNLEINGKLSFQNETDLHLKANNIFVRYGSLEIGNETNPFNGSAKITLTGESDN